MLAAHQVSLIRSGRKLLDGVSLKLEPGQVHALLGGNGAGKSSLLKLLAGELTPDGGTVTLDGQPLKNFSARALAQRRAVLPQLDELRFPFSAREVAALGRTAVSTGEPLAEAQVVTECLAATDAGHLSEAIYTRLSGGERARVQLARVLAQVWTPAAAPASLLLDEPTAALDIGHQHAALQLCRQMAARGHAVLVVLHDINLAAHYAHSVSLLRQGRLLASGSVETVMTAENLSACFGERLRFTRIEALGRLQLLAEYGHKQEV